MPYSKSYRNRLTSWVLFQPLLCSKGNDYRADLRSVLGFDHLARLCNTQRILADTKITHGEAHRLRHTFDRGHAGTCSHQGLFTVFVCLFVCLFVRQMAESYRGSYFSMTGWLIGVLVHRCLLPCLLTCLHNCLHCLCDRRFVCRCLVFLQVCRGMPISLSPHLFPLFAVARVYAGVILFATGICSSSP